MEYFDSEINVAGRNSLTILDRNFTGLVSIAKSNQLIVFHCCSHHFAANFF